MMGFSHVYTLVDCPDCYLDLAFRVDTNTRTRLTHTYPAGARNHHPNRLAHNRTQTSITSNQKTPFFPTSASLLTYWKNKLTTPNNSLQLPTACSEETSPPLYKAKACYWRWKLLILTYPS